MQNNPIPLVAGPWSWTSRRIEPATPASLGRVARAVLWVIRRRTNDPTDFNIFLTLARLKKVFPFYAAFLSQLLGRTLLTPDEKELVLLRVAWRLGCPYEYAHHHHIARRINVPTAQMVAATTESPDISVSRTVALLKSADELVRDRQLSQDSFITLRMHCSADEILELCMFVGHYVMIATIINTLGVQLEPNYAAAVD